MPAYYPVFLDVRDRRCAVIGGGDIGEEKAVRLLEYGAQVVVISPDVTDQVRALARGDGLTWIRRPYERGDLEGAFIAIVADTSDRRVNKAVHAEAAERNIPLNVVDVTELCSWIAPALVRRGDVTVAISTGGASPALARRFREELSGTSRMRTGYGVMDFADLAPLLSDARSALARRGVKLNADHWQACITDALVELVQADKSDQAAELLMTSLLIGADCECQNGTCTLSEEQ